MEEMCFILHSVNLLLIDRCTCIHRHLNRVFWYPESYVEYRGLSGCDCMAVGFTTTYAIRAITTAVVSSNRDHGEVYNIM